MNTQTLLRQLISAGMTQKRIAQHIGCTQAAISIWLSGRNEAKLKYYLKINELLAANANKEMTDAAS